MADPLPQLRGGILKAWNSGTYLAAVQIVGSLAAYITDVPVNRGIEDADMNVGDNVLLAFVDPNDPQTAVVIAVWT